LFFTKEAHVKMLRLMAAGLFLLDLPFMAPAQTENPPLPPPPYASLARDLFKELIEINTTVDTGCTRAAEAMARRLRSAGFPESDIALVGPAPQHKNLVVRYHGNGRHRPLLLICHLDVVDAPREDWSVDPFSFLEHDGYFYGRGTSDIKDEDADLVSNLLRLRQEGFVPDRDIIVALTEDEENGDANGVQWLLRNRPDLIDAEFCINPDGGGGESRNGRQIVFEFQTSEKLYADISFEVRNKGGHSAIPVSDNAIYHLAAALSNVEQIKFPVRLNETTRMYFSRIAGQESGRLRSDMLLLARQPIDTAAAERVADALPYYNSLLRTTVVPTRLAAGHANNALPQRAQAVINCRMHPDDSPEFVIATLRSVVRDTAVAITFLEHPSPSPASPVRRDVFDTTERIAHAMWPGVVVTPTLSTGASDGKYLRAAGMPVYGISGMFLDMDDVRAHGRDERIGTAEFYRGVEFMYRLLKALTSAS
jgi:acetylornithine deacetylase/succinyl-diaminopimelate desuccinylase-like protein